MSIAEYFAIRWPRRELSPIEQIVVDRYGDEPEANAAIRFEQIYQELVRLGD